MRKEKYLVNKMEEIIQEIFSELIDTDGNAPIEKVMPLLLFRKIIEKIDAINILYEQESGEPALSLSRSVIENYWYFMFMIEKDTDFRSLSYYYYDKRNTATKGLSELDYHIDGLQKYIKRREDNIQAFKMDIAFYNTQKNKCITHKGLSKILKEIPHEMQLILNTYDEYIEDYNNKINVVESKVAEFKNQINELQKNVSSAYSNKKKYQNTIQRLKKNSQFIDVRIEIDNAKRQYKDMNITWYTLRTGFSSIKQLSSSLNLVREYIPYSSLSQEVHSSNASRQIIIEDEKISLSSLRDKDGSGLALGIATNFLSYSIQPFLVFYNKESYFEEISLKMNAYIK
ncbi:DUF5677 domain-containing protein [Sporosarcina sp. G11-34]|uniref:DUF5677 domain-containing protein n=1 Tax=Sporosarcina sp. G11-34 TaxID=2849605 RepID=UPI0022A93DF1|nr:DUF5677 domain-containing protein [Sporosarcina sp. G11-34]MCZ2259425.1 hypothetical protein [Sporosarcina sp. G11-34]